MVVASTINQSQRSLQLVMTITSFIKPPPTTNCYGCGINNQPVTAYHYNWQCHCQSMTYIDKNFYRTATSHYSPYNSDINNPTTVQDPPVTTNLHLASIHHYNPTRSTSHNKPYVRHLDLHTTTTLLDPPVTTNFTSSIYTPLQPHKIHQSQQTLHPAYIHHCNPTRSTSHNKPYIRHLDLHTTATLLDPPVTTSKHGA